MKNLVFATGNPNKTREVGELLGNQFDIRSLKDIGCTEELPETNPTVEANAIQKAQYVYDHFNLDCFAEDTGLEIDALNGEPGVYSARYAGQERNDLANQQKVLEKLAGKENRSARFRTVIALIIGGKTYTFEGIAEGFICHEPAGSGGFGYDPIFQPAGQLKTFAEMDPSEKNKISHRGKAIGKLVTFLKSLNN
ncbi:MAG: RdgB/HAM1 family non-canonical purine NTP pyrophosphatase [Lewinellaceae bacterium]|nr:RdgB/HAM1 family non-canonical purine NTP pyrophosphatase [Saprospiraceae bacterium]MCB9341511.1 RdgB/HAM1 family non-canonical purine NTP pyrophosphatase [Lewinellaceae bacterium]